MYWSFPHNENIYMTFLHVNPSLWVTCGCSSTAGHLTWEDLMINQAEQLMLTHVTSAPIVWTSASLLTPPTPHKVLTVLYQDLHLHSSCKDLLIQMEPYWSESWFLTFNTHILECIKIIGEMLASIVTKLMLVGAVSPSFRFCCSFRVEAPETYGPFYVMRKRKHIECL